MKKYFKWLLPVVIVVVGLGYSLFHEKARLEHNFDSTASNYFEKHSIYEREYREMEASEKIMIVAKFAHYDAVCALADFKLRELAEDGKSDDQLLAKIEYYCAEIPEWLQSRLVPVELGQLLPNYSVQ